jgi:hypothetical protein
MLIRDSNEFIIVRRVRNDLFSLNVSRNLCTHDGVPQEPKPLPNRFGQP